MDSTCIKQTVCKILNIFQHGKYLVAYVLNCRQPTLPIHIEMPTIVSICRVISTSYSLKEINICIAQHFSIELSCSDESSPHFFTTSAKGVSGTLSHYV